MLLQPRDEAQIMDNCDGMVCGATVILIGRLECTTGSTAASLFYGHLVLLVP